MKGGTRKRGKTWSYYFDAAQIGGKRKKIEKGGFRTKKEAEAALAKALTEYDSTGQVFEPSTISVSDYLDLWYEQYCKVNLSNATQQTYQRLMNKHLKPKFGAYYLKDLKPAAVQLYINELKKKYTKSTITSILVILSSAMRYAVEPLQYIRENPCQYVKIGKVTKQPRQRDIVSDENFKKIIELYPEGTRFHIPLLIGWNCGLRINECIGLTWDRIDLQNRTITIDRQLISHVENKTSSLVFASPKHGSVRMIFFGQSLYDALKTEKKRQTENELLYGEYFTVYYAERCTDEKGIPHQKILDCPKSYAAGKERIHFVCIDENGTLTKKAMFTRCTRTIREVINAPFDYHSLRHTHTTKLVASGANIKAVQDRMGHKNISTTMNTYAHSTRDMDLETAALFEAAANGLPPK